MPPETVSAFAPGRVNLIGEHTDYNGGLALPFAIAEGITVRARARADGCIHARALDLDEHDEFPVTDPGHGRGWRAFVRGMVAELEREGLPVRGAELQIEGNLARGSGLSSSAALEVALGLALLALAGHESIDRLRLARLCSRVEREWVGASTGLLDQLASLYGEPDAALLIDFESLEIEPVPLLLSEGWRLVVVDSGERHALADSGYNERRAECVEACALLGLASLSEAHESGLSRLPSTLAKRVRHVLGENERVRTTVDALGRGELEQVGSALDASHASLRDLYDSSTPAVERTVELLKAAGASGARMVGGGFGGHVLALLAAHVEPPMVALAVRPCRGARLID